MDVAIPFKNHYPLNDKVQEFNLFFDPDKNSLDTLIEFIQTFENHIINIEYRNGIDVKTATALSKISDRVRFRLRAEDISKASQLKERGCTFFFDNSMSANCWTMLRWLVEYHQVCDVYVCDDLTYELDKVKEYCATHGVRIRMVVNRAPTSYPIGPDDFTAPLYRPQDMDAITEWIDVIEFDCGSPYDFNVLKVLYKAYVTNKFWYGQLEELNIDFKGFDMPCPGLVTGFIKKRSQCGLRCRRGGNCQSCKHCVRMARSLRDIGVQLAT